MDRLKERLLNGLQMNTTLDMQKAKLTQEMYDAQKNTVSNPAGNNQYTEVVDSENPQPKDEAHGVRTVIAKKIGMSDGYVQKAVEFGHGLDAANAVSPGFKAFSLVILPAGGEAMQKRHRKKAENTHKTNEVATMTDFSSDKTDPQGSYTGCPINPHDEPVQDVDDL